MHDPVELAFLWRDMVCLGSLQIIAEFLEIFLRNRRRIIAVIPQNLPDRPAIYQMLVSGEVLSGGTLDILRFLGIDIGIVKPRFFPAGCFGRFDNILY